MCGLTEVNKQFVHSALIRTIYVFDETRFAMGIKSTAKVVARLNTMEGQRFGLVTATGLCASTNDYFQWETIQFSMAFLTNSLSR